MKEDIVEEIILEEGVTAQLNGSSLLIKGPKGEVTKTFSHPKIEVEAAGNKITLKAVKGTKREKKQIKSFAAHIKNMAKGVLEPHVYKLKICSGHFPMTVTISGQELTIKNFFGEAVPRKVTLLPGAEVKVNGTEITVTSPDKDIAGQNAAKIESLCRITNRDKRIFQDGCYIIEKSGKVI